MAELIQKKLQGEVEKYQQLQKGKRAELVWSCPCPLSTLMRRRAPSEGRKGGYCVQRIRYPLFLATILPRIVRFRAHLMFLIVYFLSPSQT